MKSILFEVYDLLKQGLNPFLIARGLQPIKRFSLVPIPKDIFPSLCVLFRELGRAEEFSSPKKKIMKGVFNLFLILREEGKDDSLIFDYCEAICDFLEENKPEAIFWGKCGKISPLSLNSPSKRGMNIEYEVFYLT
ncbi:MAG: hypothetical protein ACP5QS_02570 [bacterium]